MCGARSGAQRQPSGCTGIDCCRAVPSTSGRTEPLLLSGYYRGIDLLGIARLAVISSFRACSHIPRIGWGIRPVCHPVRLTPLTMRIHAISNKCWLRLQRGPSPPSSVVVIATIMAVHQRGGFAYPSLCLWQLQPPIPSWGIPYDHAETSRFTQKSPKTVMIVGIMHINRQILCRSK